MAVTLKIEDKAVAKGSKKEPSPLQQAIQAARVPQDQQMGWTALGIWFVALIACCLIWQVSDATNVTFGIGMPIWCVLSILIYIAFIPNFLVKKFKERGSNSVVSQSNKPALKNLLAKAAPLLGAKEPTILIDEMGGVPRFRVWPVALIFNKSLFSLIDDNEASVLAVRGLAHLKLGHGRRLGIIDMVHSTPQVTQILVWPLVIYGRLLEKMWLPHAMQSADRLALLLIRNPQLMLSAILKEYAANDPEMKRMEVTSADVTNWINQKGHIGMEGAEISTQYKLGRAIQESPLLDDRIVGLQRWADSADYKEGVELLSKK